VNEFEADALDEGIGSVVSEGIDVGSVDLLVVSLPSLLKAKMPIADTSAIKIAVNKAITLRTITPKPKGVSYF
jgi:hypothetical protein